MLVLATPSLTYLSQKESVYIFPVTRGGGGGPESRAARGEGPAQRGAELGGVASAARGVRGSCRPFPSNSLLFQNLLVVEQAGKEPP